MYQCFKIIIKKEHKYPCFSYYFHYLNLSTYHLYLQGSAAPKEVILTELPDFIKLLEVSFYLAFE